VENENIVNLKKINREGNISQLTLGELVISERTENAIQVL
jgi:hypothetical protein